jgi:outer membrane protein OmpA-like peptidoglycan-associated protein
MRERIHRPTNTKKPDSQPVSKKRPSHHLDKRIADQHAALGNARVAQHLAHLPPWRRPQVDWANLPIHPPAPMSQPGDTAEREADAVADKVLSNALPSVPATEAPAVQRRPTVEHDSSSSSVAGSAIAPGLGAGRPLDQATRDYFEPRFGVDFSNVRVHDDEKAHEAAARLNAHAFTVGNNIAFAKGEHGLGSGEGRGLLAHELAHVVQQQTGGSAPQIQRRAAEDERPHYQPGEQSAAHRLPGDVQFEDALSCVLSNFDVGEFVLKPEHKRALHMLIEMYRLDGNAPSARFVDIEGFTDPVGEEQANIGLRGLRAAELANYLISELHVRDSLVGPAHAAESQRTLNPSPRGRADNRAVRVRLERIPVSDPATRELLDVPRESRSNRALSMQEKFEKFIGAAGRHGLPTRFLSTVAEHYHVVEGESPVTKPLRSRIELPSDTFAHELDLGLPLENQAVSSAFHEASHAFLDLAKKDPKWRLFIEVGEEHYRNAPAAGGATLSNRERILQEAVAEYVDHRAEAYWSALQSLHLAYRHNNLTPSQIDKIAHRYNEEMKKRVFGYSQGTLGLGEQVFTTRQISDELKTFIDRELLEGKLPDRFEDVPLFQRIIAESKTFKE